MSEEDRSWQIEQFETFSCQRDFSHNWDDKDHDRWRGEAWPSIDHTRELTDGLLLTNSYAPLRQNIKRQKSIWLSRWLVDTRVRQMCVWSITRNPPSIPLKVILSNNLWYTSSSSTTTTLSSSSPSSSSSSSRLVHVVAQSVYTLAPITPSTGHQENIAEFSYKWSCYFNDCICA